MKTWMISFKEKLKHGVQKDPSNVLAQLADHTIFFLVFIILLQFFVLSRYCLGNIFEIDISFWAVILLTLLSQLLLLFFDIVDDRKYLFPVLAKVSSDTSRIKYFFISCVLMFCFLVASDIQYRYSFSQASVKYQASRSLCQAYSAGKGQSVLEEMFTLPITLDTVYRERFILLMPLLGGLLDDSQEEKIRVFLLENKLEVIKTIEKYLTAENDFFSIVDLEKLSYNVLNQPSVFGMASTYDFERFKFFPSGMQSVRLDAFRLIWLSRIEQELKLISVLDSSDDVLSDLTSFMQVCCLVDQRKPSLKQLQESVAIYPFLIETGWSEKELQEIFFKRAKNRPVIDDLYGKVNAASSFWNLNEIENMKDYFCSASSGSKDNRFFNAVKQKFK